MEEFYKFLKDYTKDNGMIIEIGCKEDKRRYEMVEALNLIIESGDSRKIEFAKRVQHNYRLLDNLMNEMYEIPQDDEFGKSFVRGVYDRMWCELDTFKRCLTGSLLALAKDERKRDFYLEILCKGKEDYEEQKKLIDEIILI